jgi:hypothetical protein
VNQELRDFENAQRELNVRAKVKVQDSDSDDQAKVLDMIN